MGDLQDCLEQCIRDMPASVVVLSIDIINGDKGDLTVDENVHFWEALILDGKVAALFGGAHAKAGALLEHS